MRETHKCGWIRTAAARRIVRRAKKPLRGFFRCAARVIHPRPPRERLYRNTQTFFFYNFLKFHPQGWIRTASTRRTVRCNSDDRCQRQKQGGAVGAAASRMRVPPKARRSRWEPRPGFLFTLRGSRYPPAPTKKGRGTRKNNPHADRNPCLRTKARTRQQLLPGAGFLCVKDSEKGKGGKREFQFYAAFAGAKTSAFFRRACIERTMQLRVKLMIK